MKKRRKLLILFMILVMSLMCLYSQDKEKRTGDDDAEDFLESLSKIKIPSYIGFPGKVDVAQYLSIEASVVGNQPAFYYGYIDQELGVTSGWLGTAVYFVPQTAITVTVPVVQTPSFVFGLTASITASYSIRFDNPDNKNYLYGQGTGFFKSALSNAAVSAGAYSKTKLKLYYGLNANFVIPKIIKFDLTFEAENLLDVSGSQNYTYMYQLAKFASSLNDVYLAPGFRVRNKYDFGFAFDIEQVFYFYFYPAMWSSSPGQEVYFRCYMNGAYELSYEFFHFLKRKGIKGEVFVGGETRINVYNPQYFNNQIDLKDTNAAGTHYYYRSNLLANAMAALTPGVRFNLWGFEPSIAYYLQFCNSMDDNPLSDLWVWQGIQFDLGFKKDFFNIDFQYTIRYNTVRAGWNTQGDYSTLTPRDAAWYIRYAYPTYWENFFYITFSFNL